MSSTWPPIACKYSPTRQWKSSKTRLHSTVSTFCTWLVIRIILRSSMFSDISPIYPVFKSHAIKKKLRRLSPLGGRSNLLKLISIVYFILGFWSYDEFLYNGVVGSAFTVAAFPRSSPNKNGPMQSRANYHLSGAAIELGRFLNDIRKGVQPHWTKILEWVPIFLRHPKHTYTSTSMSSYL